MNLLEDIVKHLSVESCITLICLCINKLSTKELGELIEKLNQLLEEKKS